ncbi:hypothetical protein [Enterococcus sp. AZ103]|uniref:hypothetical protein n=1 Tax=Enterococcus sp. AZ103 TaxID=2774628 RepID=UPI003F26356C
METFFDPVEYAKECVRKEVERLMPTEILFATVDMEKLTIICSHSRTYLEQNFVCTKEAKELECSPTTKRLWKYPEIRDCWLKYCDENGVKNK